MSTIADKRTAQVLLLLAVLIRMFFTFNRALNADEFQHLHNAWMVHLGFLPYRDFWDNHTPLLSALMAPLLGIFGEGVHSVMIVRVILSLCSLAILIPVFRVVRNFIDEETAWISVALLSLSEIFMQKTIEVRPDFALSFFFLLSLWCCIRNSPRYSIGGLMLGIAALFSPKALICFSASVLLLPFARSPLNFSVYIKRATAFTLGFLIPVVVLATFFFSQKALGDLMRCTLLENLSYPDARKAAFLLFPQNLSFLLLSATGLVAWFHNNVWRHPLSVIFTIGIVLFILLAFIMPAPFSQSALMFVPIFSIASGYAIRELKGIFRILAIAAGIVVPIFSIVIANPLKKSNAPQFELMRYVLNNSNRDAVIFDGNAAYIFRKQAFYYGSLVEGVRERIRTGVIHLSAPESLIRNRCRMIIDDDRVSDLPADSQKFLRTNYVPTEYPSVYVAGKNLGAEDITGNQGVFLIDLPMVYRVETDTRTFRIDQHIYKGPAFLGKGIHRVESNGNITYVRLRAM